MMEKTIEREPVLLHKKVARNLKLSLWLFFIVGLAISASIIFHIFTGQGRVLPTVLGFFVGLWLGGIVARMYKISWDQGAQKVIARLDDLGLVILILYIIFESAHKIIVGMFVHGPELVGISLAVFDGILIGRVIGVRGKIQEIFEKQNIT